MNRPEATQALSQNTRQLLAAIAHHTEKFDQVIQEDLATVFNQRDPLLRETVEYAVLKGGKRLRPLLTLLCSRLCGRQDENLYRLAVACEYLHVASLIHDDVIDQADTRRGKRSVVQQYGLTAAVLAGDWLHSRSLYLIGRLAPPPALDLYFYATDNMVEGEFIQMRRMADSRLAEEEYLGIIEKKTAGLIASACGLGAVYARASAQQQAALMEYGRRLGLAFQIIDDLLDYQGAAASTGKEIGKDFFEGKITLPLIHTLREAGPEERAFVLAALQGDRRQGVVELCQLMEQKQSFAYSLQRAQEEVTAGLTALSRLKTPQQSEEVQILSHLARYILSRDH
jgi:octaprenyl-diphosphate synthase